ncbi:MAG: HDOD domain-containing protein [Betaproteobacteria bacterium]|jgi:HD-like signal output (HDOD) protein|nr:HDOD domain-containing protein [Betaproteobacteria bacterium]NDF70085.1 HDOD domain-containing protein [Betaproteobacteria bacterium]
MDVTPTRSLDAWIDRLTRSEIPVLHRTETLLTAMRGDVDRLSVRQVAAVVQNDPMMTCRLLVHVARLRRNSRQPHDIETTDQALLMIGVVRFIENFVRVPTIESVLSGQPEALVGALRVAVRSRRASRYATDWAALRNDLHVFEVATAALLFDMAELLAWIYAPEKALQFDAMCRENPSARTAHLQEVLFGFNFTDLKLALNRHWDAPEYLISLMDGTHTHPTPSHLTVRLAADFARHSARGWDNPALTDDIHAISDLLKMPVSTLLLRLKLQDTPLAAAMS